MAGRNSQVARVLSLLGLLESASRSLSVNEIHSMLDDRGHDASKRTIYRDLEAIQLAGLPIHEEEKSGDENESRWKLDKSAKIGQYLVLSVRELFALFLSRGVLSPLQGTPFYEDLASIFNKLESKLNTKQKEYIDELAGGFHFEPGPQWGLGLHPDVLETVRAACTEGHVLECLYYSVNSQKESVRKLGPHYLYYARGGLYLVAEDFGDHELKVFALPRMKTAAMTEEAYEGRVCTPEEMFAGAFSVFTGTPAKEIVIEFENDIAQYVRERRWHSSQRIVSLEKGRVRVHLESAETPELVSWILGFGPSARVLAPETLAERVAVKALETAGKYGKKAV